MTPNPSTIASTQERAEAMLASLQSAEVALEMQFSTVDPELGLAASEGNYLPAVAYVIRFLAGGDALAHGNERSIVSPADILAALQNPSALFAAYATALDAPFRLAKSVELDMRPFVEQNESIAEGLDGVKHALVTIAAVALRGLRDGERAGWWKVTPEGYGSLGVSVLPESAVNPNNLVLHTTDDPNDNASAYEQIVLLARFLDERSGTPREVILNNAVVNEAIAALASGGLVAVEAQTDSPFVSDADERAYDAMLRLANFVMGHVPGEPSRSEGVVDTVIRVIRGIDAKANG